MMRRERRWWWYDIYQQPSLAEHKMLACVIVWWGPCVMQGHACTHFAQQCLSSTKADAIYSYYCQAQKSITRQAWSYCQDASPCCTVVATTLYIKTHCSCHSANSTRANAQWAYTWCTSHATAVLSMPPPHEVWSMLTLQIAIVLPTLPKGIWVLYVRLDKGPNSQGLQKGRVSARWTMMTSHWSQLHLLTNSRANTSFTFCQYRFNMLSILVQMEDWVLVCAHDTCLDIIRVMGYMGNWRGQTGVCSTLMQCPSSL